MSMLIKVISEFQNFSKVENLQNCQSIYELLKKFVKILFEFKDGLNMIFFVLKENIYELKLNNKDIKILFSPKFLLNFRICF